VATALVAATFSLVLGLHAAGPWQAASSNPARVASIGAVEAPRAPADVKPTVILVSLDGFRPDYLSRVKMPNLERLITRGVRAEWMIPSYPSKTFPNHYTIVTGLYPGHHGIVANNIWDDKIGKWFSLSKRDQVQNAAWWGGEPIWVTAAKAGQKSATMFWPGSEAPIGGAHAAYWQEFDDKMPGGERVAKILGWLDLPADQRPTFLTLYFEESDNAGHANPLGEHVPSALQKIDGWMGELLDGLDQRGLTDLVNVVVVSDHGMSPTSRDRMVVLDDYISLDDVTIVDLNPTLALDPKPGKEEQVYRALKKAKHLRVYRKRESPKHWHYREHPRVPAIVGVVDDEWQVVRRSTVEAIDAGKQPRLSGQHGYDPKARSMRALFIAAGPAFRQGVVVKPFENVSLYNVFARILGVTPARNDGDPRVMRKLLR